jgi:hypothetical protein
MAKVFVNSKNQKGGITANNVNIDNQINQIAANSHGRTKKILTFTGIAILLAGLVDFLTNCFGIFEYFGIKP